MRLKKLLKKRNFFPLIYFLSLLLFFVPMKGYVALKVDPFSIYYADWTHTTRKYKWRRLTEKEREDLRRIFRHPITVLLVQKERTLRFLQNLLCIDIPWTRCVQVENLGSAREILYSYLKEHRKKPSYYNYQRDLFLSLLTMLNVYLTIHETLSRDQILHWLQNEMNYTHARRSKVLPSQLLQRFLDLGLLVQSADQISLPDRKSDRTLV